MNATAFITHRTADRLRLRIPSQRHDSAYFEELTQRLVQVEGVIRVEANPQTAGVLVIHDEVSPAVLFGAAADLLVPSATEYLPERVVDTVAKTLERISGQIERSGRGTADAPAVLFLLLAAMALMQIRRGAILSPASTLLWYAFEVVRRGRTGS